MMETCSHGHPIPPGSKSPSRRCSICTSERLERYRRRQGQKPRLRFPESFWRNVDKSGPGGCWLWTAAVDRGYGNAKAQGRTRTAHRVSYELLVGPVPDGLQLDHLCRVRNCVNPAHLEPVTPRENTLRSEAITAVLAERTHCNNGHPFDAENTKLRPDGYRMCIACCRTYQRLKARAYRAAKKAAASTGPARFDDRTITRVKESLQ